MPRVKTYDYYCCARTGGAFAIVDFRNMLWAYMYRDTVKANKKNIMFSEKKETYMRPFYSLMHGGQLMPPSTYFFKDATPQYGQSQRFQMRNSMTNRAEDLWAVPYDTFIEACGNNPDLTSLLVLYGGEALYDKIIMTFMNNRYISNWENWQPLS